MAITPTHRNLQNHVKADKPDAPWHPQPSPDGRVDAPQGYLDLVRSLRFLGHKISCRVFAAILFRGFCGVNQQMGLFLRLC